MGTKRPKLINVPQKGPELLTKSKLGKRADRAPHIGDSTCDRPIWDFPLSSFSVSSNVCIFAV